MQTLRIPRRLSLGRWLTALAMIAALGTPAVGRAAESLPPLPEGIASFGAAVVGDDLYVYGGHIGKTHQHSVENLSHHFRRLDLSAPATGWQEVGEVAGLQGLPLVAIGERVCRVGGLTARNHQEDEKEDLHSQAEVSCYVPEPDRWQALPPLPAPRSSHDAAVLGNHLYVAGGWQLRGKDAEPVWHDTMLVLDLEAPTPVWRSLPQPFQRRALAVAAAGGKVYVLGGLGGEGTSRQVDVFDVATETWSAGPELPPQEGRLKGFGVSAFGVGERIFFSGADGVVHALETGGDSWLEDLGRLDTPRFFHRLLPYGEELLFVGGAASSGHLADVERVDIGSLQPRAGAEAEVAVADRGSWPGFRGRGDSHTAAADLPLSWSSERNIAWRAALPGYGQSSPVVWDGQVFVTSVSGAEKETLILSSLDLESGEVRWRRRFAASQEITSSDMVSRAAPTPAVDGERVYAFWESGDLVALSHEGETLWQRSLTDEYGPFTGNHGVGSSPVLTDQAVVVQATHEGPSYYLAVDKESGENLWKVERPSKVAWTTPVVLRGDEGTEVITSAAGRVEALDATSGEAIWQLAGIEKNHVPSATTDGDLVIVASSETGHSLALHNGGHGTLDEGAILWRGEGIASGFGSPLIHDDCVLFVNKAGTVTCADRSSGETRWRHRVADACWTSPIAAGDMVYFFTKKGETTVLRHGEDGPEVVAESSLPTEDTVYGVAAVRGAFVIRTGTELVRVGRDEEGESGSAVAAADTRKNATGNQMAER